MVDKSNGEKQAPPQLEIIITKEPMRGEEVEYGKLPCEVQSDEMVFERSQLHRLQCHVWWRVGVRRYNRIRQRWETPWRVFHSCDIGYSTYRIGDAIVVDMESRHETRHLSQHIIPLARILRIVNTRVSTIHGHDAKDVYVRRPVIKGSNSSLIPLMPRALATSPNHAPGARLSLLPARH